MGTTVGKHKHIEDRIVDKKGSSIPIFENLMPDYQHSLRMCESPSSLNSLEDDMAMFPGETADAFQFDLKEDSRHNTSIESGYRESHHISFDNSDEVNDMARGQKRLRRQGRSRGNPKWKRGDITDARASYIPSPMSQESGYVGSHQNLDDIDVSKKMGRKWQNRNRRNERKPQWIIDKAAWKSCIETRNTRMIDELLSEKKLPDKNLLNKACEAFDLKFRRSICDEICKHIVQKSCHIICVYPATMVNDKTKESDDRTITFVVIIEQEVDLGNDFKFHIKNTNGQAPQENVKIKICEKEKEECVSKNEIDLNIARLTKCIQKNSIYLRNNHSNVCRISHSGFKSKGFDKGGCSMKQIDCITLYVYAKGFIPLGEKLLPEKLDEVLVDVREGFVEAYAGNHGPYDILDNVRMGCSIGGGLHMNGEAVNGTLGGFFEMGGADLCISSAHTFLSANEMKLLEKQETPLLERIDLAKDVYQPHNNYVLPFGTCRTAVYTEGGNGATGVDVVSILIKNRNPNTGEFPKCDRGQESHKEYSRGKVYNREEIRNVLKRDANRRFYKYGCRTGWTTGKLRSECASFRALHPSRDGTKEYKISLDNQFELSSDTDKDFAGKTDSGALVFMEDGGELVAVGMVVAGMADEVCFVTPLDEIFKALKVDPKNGFKNFTTGVNRSSVKTEIAKLTCDLSNVKSDINDMKSDMKDVKGEMEDIKNMLQNIHLVMQKNSDKNS